MASASSTQVLVQRATAAEGQGNFAEARELYIQAVEMLLQQLRTSDNPAQHASMMSRANVLLHHAESLPTVPPPPPPPPTPPPPAPHPVDLKQQGIQVLKDAVAADHAGHIAQAITLYQQGMQMLQTCAAQDPNPRFRKAVAVKVDQYQQRCAVLSAMNTEQHAAHATRVGGDAGASAEGFEMDGQQQREQHGQHGQHDAGQHPVHHGSGGFPPSVGPPHPSTQPSIMPAATHAAAPAPPLPSHVSTNSNGGLPLSSSLTRHGTGVSQRSMLVNSRSNSGYSQTEWRDIAIGYAKEATQAHAQGQLPHAVDCYIEAIDALEQYRLMENNPKLKQRVKEHQLRYLKIAEGLKVQLGQHQQEQQGRDQQHTEQQGQYNTTILTSNSMGPTDTPTNPHPLGPSFPMVNTTVNTMVNPQRMPSAPPLVDDNGDDHADTHAVQQQKQQHLQGLLHMLLHSTPPGVAWKDVVGLEEAKQVLTGAVLAPLAAARDGDDDGGGCGGDGGGSGDGGGDMLQQQGTVQQSTFSVDGHTINATTTTTTTTHEAHTHIHHDDDDQHTQQDNDTHTTTTTNNNNNQSTQHHHDTPCSRNHTTPTKPRPPPTTTPSHPPCDIPHVLLYGPPGCGKAHLLRALATHAHCTMFTIPCWFLASKQLATDCADLVDMVFAHIQSHAPALLLLEDVEALSAERSSGAAGPHAAAAALVCNMQRARAAGLPVCVAAVTSEPYCLDGGLLGAFEVKLWVPPPDASARAALLSSQLAATPTTLLDYDIVQLAKQLEGWSCADCMQLVAEAASKPLTQLQGACYFEPVPRGWGSDKESLPGVYRPCSPNTPGAVACTLEDIIANKGKEAVVPLPVSQADFDQVLGYSIPSIKAQHMVLLEEFRGRVEGRGEKAG